MAFMSFGCEIVQGRSRIVYAMIQRGTIHVLHAFKKTTATTPVRNLNLATKRLKEVQP